MTLVAVDSMHPGGLVVGNEVMDVTTTPFQAALGTPPRWTKPPSCTLGVRVAHGPAGMFMFSSVLKPDPPQAGISCCTCTRGVFMFS